MIAFDMRSVTVEDNSGMPRLDRRQAFFGKDINRIHDDLDELAEVGLH